MKTCLSKWQAIAAGSGAYRAVGVTDKCALHGEAAGAVRYLALAGSMSGAEIDVERLRETMREQLQVALFTKNGSECVQS